MDESFVITATYKNREIDFDAELRPFGYSYSIMVMVNDTEVIYEPDEERNFRALIKNMDETDSLPDQELLQSIGEALEKAFR